MKEVYVVCCHRMFGGDSEIKEIELVTTDHDKARSKESEIDALLGQWASVTTMELVE